MTAPTFLPKSVFARWVPEVNLGRGGRVSSTAFLPADGEDHLSVNAMEIEGISAIAKHYREHLAKSARLKVAISCLKVMNYTEAVRGAGVPMILDKTSGKWHFDFEGGLMAAYKHRPTHQSSSHCGIEAIKAIKAMKDDAINRFARRLSGQPIKYKPHWY